MVWGAVTFAAAAAAAVYEFVSPNEKGGVLKVSGHLRRRSFRLA